MIKNLLFSVGNELYASKLMHEGITNKGDL